MKTKLCAMMLSLTMVLAALTGCGSGRKKADISSAACIADLTGFFVAALSTKLLF